MCAIKVIKTIWIHVITPDAVWTQGGDPRQPGATTRLASVGTGSAKMEKQGATKAGVIAYVGSGAAVRRANTYICVLNGALCVVCACTPVVAACVLAYKDMQEWPEAEIWELVLVVLVCLGDNYVLALSLALHSFVSVGRRGLVAATALNITALLWWFVAQWLCEDLREDPSLILMQVFFLATLAWSSFSIAVLYLRLRFAHHVLPLLPEELEDTAVRPPLEEKSKM